MQIKIINKSSNPLPGYETTGSAGIDLRANIEQEVLLQPLERILIKTGLFIELPPLYEAQIRPRSGLALKNGITVLNSPGTIDADYRGEIGVILINLSNQTYTIKPGTRIAQMIVGKITQASWIEVEKIDKTERDGGGFGSTGLN